MKLSTCTYAAIPTTYTNMKRSAQCHPGHMPRGTQTENVHKHAEETRDQGDKVAKAAPLCFITGLFQLYSKTPTSENSVRH